MENSNSSVENRRLGHIVHRNGQDVAHQHVLEMLGFACGLAHRENGSCGSHRIRNANEGFLGNTSAAGAGESKYGRAHESEYQT